MEEATNPEKSVTSSRTNFSEKLLEKIDLLKTRYESLKGKANFKYDIDKLKYSIEVGDAKKVLQLLNSGNPSIRNVNSEKKPEKKLSALTKKILD